MGAEEKAMGTGIPPSRSFGRPHGQLGSASRRFFGGGWQNAFPPSWVETWRDGEKGRDGVCHTGLFFPLLSSCSSPLSFRSCLKLPAGLKEGETVQLHVDLLAGAGHITTAGELIFHFPKSFGQGRLLPASDLPGGF